MHVTQTSSVVMQVLAVTARSRRSTRCSNRLPCETALTATLTTNLATRIRLRTYPIAWRQLRAYYIGQLADAETQEEVPGVTAAVAENTDKREGNVELEGAVGVQKGEALASSPS